MIRKAALLDRLVSWSPVLLLGGLAALTYWLDAQIQADTARRDGNDAPRRRHVHREFSRRQFRRRRAPPPIAVGAARRASSGRRKRRLCLAVACAHRSRPPAHVGRGRCGHAVGRPRDRDVPGQRARDDATRCPRTRRRARACEGPITLTADTLKVVPKKGRAETEGPVTVEEPRGIIHAVGMAVDNEAQTIKLHSGVRGTLSPEIAPK